jgi:ATP-dependent Clp protease ATP-binding subunit ClpA
VGFGGAAGEDREKPDADREYKQLFSPEFRNRLDAKIAFCPLDPAVMKSIVGKFVRELGEQLAERGVTIELTEAATAYLAKKGYDPDNGARPLARIIQSEVKESLGEELLFGALEHGGRVTVDATDNKLIFAFAGQSAADGQAQEARVGGAASP